MGSSASRVTLQINLGAISRNYERIARFVAPLNIMAVLKANAYGLGVRAIANKLAECGASFFGVAEPKEAEEIADMGVPVMVLGNMLVSEIEGLIERGVHVPVNSLKHATMLSQVARATGKPALCHLLLDTGMGRLGIPADALKPIAKELFSLEGVEWEGIYTHFPCAHTNPAMANQQVATLLSLIDWIDEACGVKFKHRHIANSDGIQNIPAAIQPPFTMVRTGLNLYGSFDIEGGRQLALEPAIRLYSKLMLIRNLPAGSTIGYGSQCVLEKPCRVGTVGIGYADGLPLHYSSGGYVMVGGHRCPILGRTSMDYTTINLEGVPDAEEGDEVLCLGGEITTLDWAKAKKTIPYEVICSIGSRVARTYTE
jgi:alanine racemase